ncbi:MAG: hypothetical protein JO141_19580 [Bradyrhizobium sp.]|nr:hypothetical protein [Bradyrhizobium sp.]
MKRGVRIFLGLAAILGGVFAFATTIFSYLTDQSALLPSCAGHDVLQGFRVGAADLIAPPLFSFGYLALLIRMARSQSVFDELEKHDLTIFQLSSLRISHGMFVIGAVCLGFVAFNGLIARESVARYYEVARYCQSTAQAAHIGHEARV